MSTPIGRWVGQTFIEFTPEEAAAVAAEWEQSRAEMTARAADAALEARIARRIRIQAIDAEIATEADPDVRSRLAAIRDGA